MILITDEDLQPALQGVIPAVIATSSADGTPNITYISQVYYVDENHVALSRQFFNKTIRNICENPQVLVTLTNPLTNAMYNLSLEFRESQQAGKVFDEMKLQLDVIADTQGKKDVFSLLAADIYYVRNITRIYPMDA